MIGGTVQATNRKVGLSKRVEYPGDVEEVYVRMHVCMYISALASSTLLQYLSSSPGVFLNSRYRVDTV